MPYVGCSGCGTTSYAPRSYVAAADCPVCGTRLLDPPPVVPRILQPAFPPPPLSAPHGRQLQRP